MWSDYSSQRLHLGQTNEIPDRVRDRYRSSCSLPLAVALILGRLTRRAQRQSPVLSGAALQEFTSLEPIDAHTHISQTGPAFVAMLDRLHMHVLDILYVDDTTPYRVSP